MKIGIFGGSFNPPHKMHVNIANELINKQYVDKVIFVPTGSKYKYKTNLLEDRYRLDMLEIISNKYKNLSVSSFEMKEYVVYTIDTLTYFKEKYPNDEIFFICGTDNLSYIDKWKDGKKILEQFKLLVVDREGNSISELLNKYKLYENSIKEVSISSSTISSTQIRNCLKEKEYEEVASMVDSEVLSYIKEHNLYETVV